MKQFKVNDVCDFFDNIVEIKRISQDGKEIRILFLDGENKGLLMDVTLNKVIKDKINDPNIKNYNNIKAKVVKDSDESLQGFNFVHPFKIGHILDVEEIRMGSSMTTVSLMNCDGLFNSLLFEFYENGEILDIYNDKRFNTYMK